MKDTLAATEPALREYTVIAREVYRVEYKVLGATAKDALAAWQDGAYLEQVTQITDQHFEETDRAYIEGSDGNTLADTDGLSDCLDEEEDGEG